MSTVLDEILAVTRKRVEQLKIQRSLADLAREAERIKTTPRGFRKSLLAASENGGVAIIAELKKASPSKGVIRGTFHVGGLAMQLEKAGAAALSVLTEEKFFDGSLGNLQEASAASNLPCLRKDFIVDQYQIYESRLNRADAILLIVAACGYSQITSPVIRANFGVDADLRSNFFNGFVQSGNDDWFMLPGSVGTGKFVIDTTGAAAIVARYPSDIPFRRSTFAKGMIYPPFSIINNRLLLDAAFVRDFHGDDDFFSRISAAAR